MPTTVENNAEFKVSPEQLGLLHHTLGLSPHQRGSNRNYFLSSGSHRDQANLLALTAAGYMHREAAPSWTCGDDLFSVTTLGRDYALANLPPEPAPVKYSKYDEYLRAESNCTFAEWLGIEVPRREYSAGRFRLVSSKAIGGWAKTQKEAKALYKLALRAARTSSPRQYQSASEFNYS